MKEKRNYRIYAGNVILSMTVEAEKVVKASSSLSFTKDLDPFDALLALRNKGYEIHPV